MKLLGVCVILNHEAVAPNLEDAPRKSSYDTQVQGYVPISPIKVGYLPTRILCFSIICSMVSNHMHATLHVLVSSCSALVFKLGNNKRIKRGFGLKSAFLNELADKSWIVKDFTDQ